MLMTFLFSPAAFSARASDGHLPDPETLLRFRPGDETAWTVINDGVMGGLSRSGMRTTAEGTGLFSGLLSLENDGGFVSTRAATDRPDWSGYGGVELRVRGDGRTYQLRLRTDDSTDGTSYRASFETRAAEWTSVRIPFADFRPTYRGRILRDAPPLDTSSLRQIGFLLADGRPGSFRLEIDTVRAWRED
jgi:monofunctional biosynthetic peptidoglycan transglycosylase